MERPDTKSAGWILPVVITILLCLSVWLRVRLLPFMNNDLSVAVIPWYQYLLDHGGLYGIQGLVYGSSYFHPYSYSPPYLYLLMLASPLTRWLPLITVIKLVSIVFDYVSAYYAYRIAGLKHPEPRQKWAAFFLVLFAPTVFINSAYWGQCDGLYGAFLMAALNYLLAGRKGVSYGVFFAAVIIKVQALVLAPLYLVLFLKRQIDWRWLLAAPLVYLTLMAPAFLTGYPLSGTLNTLAAETEAFGQLTMNAPTLFAFFPGAPYRLFSLLGLAAAALTAALLVWHAWRSKGDLDAGRMLVFAVLVAAAMPFLLPKMHERYFYAAALISLLLPFYLPILRIVPLALQCSSLFSYIYFLRGYEMVPLAVPAAINLAVLLYLSYFYLHVVDSNPSLC